VVSSGLLQKDVYLRKEGERMSAYRKGRRAENYIKQLLIAKGFSWIMRSAQSRGGCDLLASNGSGLILGVQVKCDGSAFSPKEIRKLVEWANSFLATPVKAYLKNGRWILETVEGAKVI